MTLLIAVILGIIQGLTEFIPISSTAHLTIAGALFGVVDPARPEEWTAFMATIQLGTLLSVLVYFWRDVADMCIAMFSEVLRPWRRAPSTWSPQARLAVLVVLGTIPIVIVGLVARKLIEGSFTKDLTVISISLIGVALLLWWAEKRASLKRHVEDLTIMDTLAIGSAQVLALIPGVSRSGSTIMAGLFQGLAREDAARFSFLLSIPAILGAGVFEFVGELEHLSWREGGLELAVATLAAMISGYLAIAFLLRYLRTRSLGIFIGYRIVLGITVLITACSPEQKHDSALTETKPAQPAVQRTPANAEAEIPTAEPTITNHVRIRTSMGSIRLALYSNDAPRTVENFLALVSKRYYDHTHIHRVVPGFVIQMGDPTSRQLKAKAEWGRGGSTANGEPLQEELDSLSPSGRIGYQPGVVAMARKPERGSGTSQFFICLEKAASLPYQYTIFGRVTEGMDVVQAISQVPLEPGVFGDIDPMPRKPILIHSIRID